MADTFRAAGARRGLFRHPAQYVVAAFVVASLAGALLLSLPVATAGGGRAPLDVAVFTATSAVCVNGLTVVDTPTYWSGFGEAVVLGLVQVGGLGIMTISSTIAVALVRRLGLRQRMIAATEAGTLALGDVRRLLVGVARFSIVVEVVAAVALTARFWLAHDVSFGRAGHLGVFHAVTAFNNAGLALFSDSLAGFAHDPTLLVIVGVTVVLGGLGYPVWKEVARRPTRPRRWDLHAKITVTTTAALLVAGTALFAWFEWANPGTLGPFSGPDKLVNAWFQGVTPRSAGFSTVEVAGLRDASLLLTEVLMYIGGGSASTAGGIKVTTFALLAWTAWSEARGDADVVAFRRRVPVAAQRQALAVALLSLAVIVTASMALTALSGLPREDLRFEVTSALGTTGLSTGLTPELPTPSRLVVVGLMILGRVGPITLFAALVLREREALYRHPEGRPIIG